MTTNSVINSTLEKKKGGKIIGEKEKTRSKMKEGRWLKRHKALPRAVSWLCNISRRCYIYFETVPLVLLWDFYIPEQCIIVIFRMGNFFFSFIKWEKRDVKGMSEKKKKDVVDLRHHSHTHRVKSWRSGKLFPSNLLTLIQNYLRLKSDI